MLSPSQDAYITLLRKDYPNLPEVQIRGMLANAKWDEAMIDEGLRQYSLSASTNFSARPSTFIAGGIIALLVIGSFVGAWIYFSGAKNVAQEHLATNTAVPLVSVSSYTRGEDAVFWKGVLMPGVDSETFVPLDDHYAKDSRAVYFDGIPIIGADMSTFTLVPPRDDHADAEDKLGPFQNGSRMHATSATDDSPLPALTAPPLRLPSFIVPSSDGTFRLDSALLTNVLSGDYSISSIEERRLPSGEYSLIVIFASSTLPFSANALSLTMAIEGKTIPASLRDKVLIPMKRSAVTRVDTEAGSHLTYQKNNVLWFPRGDVDYLHLVLPPDGKGPLLDRLLELYPPDEAKFASSTAGIKFVKTIRPEKMPTASTTIP